MTMRSLAYLMIAMFAGSILFFLFPLVALAILAIAVIAGGMWLLVIPAMRNALSARLGTRGAGSSGFYARSR
jgi:hypothetical protein